ncbi:uncharacterized protein LOC141620931 [Silene latifolia]|uniref:uncharacterized protein LOC141620931 n=1 Tax=Silene latifolia TaxID=37657 RepID=UPI003D76A6FD
MTRGITCWSDASEEEKERWFNNFRQNYHWPKEQERAVWERYNYIGKKRLRDNMYKVSKRKKPPQFMEGTAYKELMEKRDTPEFKEKSARAAINKRGGKKDAHIDATHYGGSQSFYDRAMSNVPPDYFLKFIHDSDQIGD